MYRPSLAASRWGNRTSAFILLKEIEFVQGLNHSTGKNIGIYPEIKAPWFHHQEGKDIAASVLQCAEDIRVYSQAG